MMKSTFYVELHHLHLHHQLGMPRFTLHPRLLLPNLQLGWQLVVLLLASIVSLHHPEGLQLRLQLLPGAPWQRSLKRSLKTSATMSCF
ncbi:unnamed protein product [Mycena citricolor]|uniref:Uncharacterized protein n=1 Tax=Mycena citricolor TaxID=2018698 RepID=A0AAD2H5Y3_9AGAR|nr:unnamed protein product [Mycena citricolor]